MWKLNVAVVLSAMLVGGVASAPAQQIHLPPAVSQSQGMGDVPVTQGSDVQRKQAMAANLQRQQEMRRDSEKMLQLMQELNQYLQNKTPGTVSLDAVKKAEQIEKLAHSVRTKMKQSF